MPRLVQPLAAGPLDLIGDVHGELGALQELTAKLGYDEKGRHCDGRTLVFLGDLVDRGPDSPGVVARVQSWVETGRAQCVCGNHELNLLLAKHRKGNNWFYGEEQTLEKSGLQVPQVLADDNLRADLRAFFATLPLALERDDLVVAHACWRPSAIDALRDISLAPHVAFRQFEHAIAVSLPHRGIARKTQGSALAFQNENPVGICTSGLEQPTTGETFMAGGKPREEERVAWWTEWPVDGPDVVFGHYWRAVDINRKPVHRGPYLFPDTPLKEPLGLGRNAWCIDFSAGYRNLQRASGGSAPAPTALAALRWPEKEIVQVIP